MCLPDTRHCSRRDHRRLGDERQFLHLKSNERISVKYINSLGVGDECARGTLTCPGNTEEEYLTKVGGSHESSIEFS